MGRARIEPDVEDVIDLLPFVGIVVGLEETRGRAGRVPGIGAFLLERVGDALVDARIVEDLDRAVPLLADEHGDRHAPGALARDHPVGLALDHAGDAVLALRRHPAGGLDGGKGAVAQRVLYLSAPLIPAQAGIQGRLFRPGSARPWVPAFAGTSGRDRLVPRG